MANPPMRIGIIGLGTIGTAVIEALAPDGHSITIPPRSAQNAATLCAKYANVAIADPQTVIDRSDVIFLGLPSATGREALGHLAFRAGQQVISLMAEARRADLEPRVAPATLAARMIPFPSLATSPSPILAQGDTALIRALFGARNTVFQLATEAELHRWLCAQAILSPAVLMVKLAANWLAEGGSDPAMAEQFLRELIGTSLQATPCDPLLRALDTPNGYNQRLRQHMLAAGLADSLSQGLDRLQS